MVCRNPWTRLHQNIVTILSTMHLCSSACTVLYCTVVLNHMIRAAIFWWTNRNLHLTQNNSNASNLMQVNPLVLHIFLESMHKTVYVFTVGWWSQSVGIIHKLMSWVMNFIVGIGGTPWEIINNNRELKFNMQEVPFHEAQVSLALNCQLYHHQVG